MPKRFIWSTQVEMPLGEERFLLRHKFHWVRYRMSQGISKAKVRKAPMQLADLLMVPEEAKAQVEIIMEEEAATKAAMPEPEGVGTNESLVMAYEYNTINSW